MLALALLGSAGLAEAQAPSATPTASPAPRAIEAKLSISLGAAEVGAVGWGAVEVRVEHFVPRSREAELILEYRQPDRAAPLWTARRTLTLTAGLENAPSRRREWFRIPLRAQGTLITARLLSREPTLLGTGRLLLDLRLGSSYPSRTLLFVSSKPTRASDAAALLIPAKSQSPFSVQVRRPEQLPPLRAGYRGLDLVLLHEADLGRSSPPQREALLGWVESGGSVLLIPGRSPRWYSSPGIAELISRREVIRHTVDRLPNLERAFGSLVQGTTPRSNFEVFQLGDAPPAPLATLTGTHLNDLTERLRFGHSYPFLQGVRRGRGLVFSLAADPLGAPLSRWRGQAAFCLALEPKLEACGVAARNFPNEDVDLYVDGELFQLLDSNQRPPSGVVVGILILYLLCVGPLNVLLIRRSGRQPIALAWSVPLCALGFTFLVLIAGFFTKGLGGVVWRGTVIKTIQESPHGQAELALTLRTSVAAPYRIQIASGASLLRVVRVEEAINPQVVNCDAGQAQEGVRLDTWEQALLVGRGEVALGEGVRARQRADGSWVARNGSTLGWERVALLAPDLYLYTGGPCGPGESTDLEKGPHVSARYAAGETLAKLLFDSRPEQKVAAGLLARHSSKSLRLPGPCLVVRLTKSPFTVKVGDDEQVQLDVPLLVAPAAAWRASR
ncbi:MAG: hypothetical protein JKY65_24640 [Planctomycetes bacterium]|nr:hypothetical protein [Planctomycetota bacterium]